VTSWSINGHLEPSRATLSGFFGVSCRSTTCVGSSTDGSGIDATLAEIRAQGLEDAAPFLGRRPAVGVDRWGNKGADMSFE